MWLFQGKALPTRGSGNEDIFQRGTETLTPETSGSSEGWFVLGNKREGKGSFGGEGEGKTLANIQMCCVIQSRSCNLSGPQCPHLHTNGDFRMERLTRLASLWK